MRVFFKMIIGLASVLLAASVTGCATPCILVYDLQAGKKTGSIPMQPNFTREMILRAEPDNLHFTTVSFFEPKMRWQLRTYDMGGAKISETEIQDCAEEYYSAIVADMVTASSDSPTAFSVTEDGAPYEALEQLVLTCLDIKSGKTRKVPLSYAFPIPSEGYKRVVCRVFTHHNGGVWAMFADWTKDTFRQPPIGPDYYALCQLSADGVVTPVFKHEGLTPSAFATSRDGSVLAYVESGKDAHLIRVVQPEQKKIVREIDSNQLDLRWTSCMAFDSSGKTLFVSGRGMDNYNHLIKYDIATGAWEKILSGKRVHNIIPTGKSHICVYRNGKFVVIDIATGKIVYTITGNRLNYLHASPDGRYVIVQCN